MLGIKQAALALELGRHWNQRKVSLLEQRETIKPELLIEIAHTLDVSVDSLREFDEKVALLAIQQHYIEANSNKTQTLNEAQFIPARLLERALSMFEKIIEIDREKTDLIKEILKIKR